MVHIAEIKEAYHEWTPSCGWAWPLLMRLGENVWRRDLQRERNTGGFLWPSPAWRGGDTQIKKEKIDKNETKNCQWQTLNATELKSLEFSWIRMVPVVGDSGSLYEAGCISLLEQLLCVGHQACMLQQASPLWDLGRQGLLPPAAGSLQGQSQGPLTLCHSRSQLSDTVRQLMESHCTVRL